MRNRKSCGKKSKNIKVTWLKKVVKKWPKNKGKMAQNFSEKVVKKISLKK